MNRLFNPFRYIAGTKALILGIMFIISSALLLYSVDMIQDSYIHLGMADVTLWQVILVQFVWWILPAMLLYAGGLLLSKSQIRIIDVLGTTAFAQLLLIPMIAPMLIPSVKDGGVRVVEALLKGLEANTTDLVAIMIYGIWSTLLLVLFYVWNYHAFATSCNVKGNKAIIYFIAVQLIISIAGTLF